ncbi:MAG: tetratricopeptide repeat protein [bacterium]|jgi:cytochrome c-type biogenesis protein CcmH/NrfG
MAGVKRKFLLAAVAIAFFAIAATVSAYFIKSYGESKKREEQLRREFAELKKSVENERGVARADRLAKEGNVDAAIAMLENGLTGSGTAPATHVALGDLYLKSGRREDAIREYEKALESDPNNAEVLKKQIDLLVEDERIGRACEKLEKLLAIDPNDTDTRLRLANFQFENRDYTLASENYSKVIALKGDDPVALQGLGHIALYQNNSNRAMDFYTRAVAVDPSLAESWYFLARIRFRNEEYADAAIAMRKALSLNYPDPELRLMLAYALEYDGKIQDAIKEFKRFLAENPEHPDAGTIQLHVSQLEFWEAPPHDESQNVPATVDIWGREVTPGNPESRPEPPPGMPGVSGIGG